MIIAQMSDPHITVGGTLVHNRSVAEQLRRAVDHLLRLPASPDVVLVTGDCVDGGNMDEYQLFQDLLRPLTMPVYVIPGNHDHRGRMREAFGPQGTAPLGHFMQYVVDEWPIRLIGLDTHVPGQGGGDLCDERLQWLEARLAEAPNRPAIIFMHHPPFPTGLAVFDQIGLNNADRFGDVIARHPQVERILAGHVHSTMMRRFSGTLAVTCPSTMHQMLPDFHQPERLAVMMEPPAYLLHVWRDGTGLTTHTSLIDNHGPLRDLHDGVKWLA